MQNNTLYLLRGLPGAGKSTLAKTFSPNHYIEADMFMINEETGEYEFDVNRLASAHRWCQCETELKMEMGAPEVVVSNTFTTEKEMKPYMELAEKYNYRVVTLIVENRHGSKSIHGVPESTMKKMENRFSIKLR